MAGLGPFLAGFGPGLADALEKGRRAKAQEQEQQLRTFQLQQYLKQQTQQTQAESAFLNSSDILGGGNLNLPSPVGGDNPVASLFGGGQSAPSMDQGPSSLGRDIMGTQAPVLKGSGYDIPKLYDLAVKAGFQPGEEAATHASIMMAESSGNPGAHNTKGEDSIGLNQVNRQAWGPNVPTDPLGNTKFAHDVVYQKQGWPAWSVYKNGAYKKFLPEAMRVAEQRGGGAGGGSAVTGEIDPTSGPVTPVVGALGGPDPINLARMGPADTSPAARQEGARELMPGAQPAQFSPGELPGGAFLPQSAPSEVREQSDAAARNTASGIQAQMPQIAGQMSIKGLADQIRQRNPGIDDHAVVLTIQKLLPLVSKRQQQQWEIQIFQYENQIRRQEKLEDEGRQEQRHQRERVFDNANPPEPQTGKIFLNPETGESRSFSTKPGTVIPKGWVPEGSGQTKASNNIEVTDSTGKVVFSGAAHQTPQGWVSDKDNKPIEAGEGDIKILGRGSQGRQAAAQIQSMIGASSELVGEAKNLMELPSSATAGLFQGLQAVPASELGDALKRTLANKITPEEATDLKTSFQGVSRSLATIEAQGRATGLVGLTGMSEQLMPQDGDTQGNVLRKMATLRQIMERNIDAIASSPNATREQKEFLKGLRGEMETVIPFTVSDVNKLQHGDKESVAVAAQKFGLGRKPQEPGTAPVPGTVQDGFRFKGGDPSVPGSWERVQ